MAISKTRPKPTIPSNLADQLRVLVIDDQVHHAEVVAEALETIGFECEIADGGEAGAERIEQGNLDLILTDLYMEDLDGFAILKKANEEIPDCQVVMITGRSDVKSAVEAMQQGAAHYLTKPLQLGELRAIINKAAENLRLHRQNRELRRQLDEKFGFEGVVGESAQMHRVMDVLKHVAPTKASIIVLGETGTGKELVARAIHNNSDRRNKPFLAINCTALNENLLDDELFGHDKWAYTDARKARKGKFEAAHGGTLFLDEIGDMSLKLQAKLLRALDAEEITRIGENDPVKVDVRVISATHRDLEAAVSNGEFRRDLYHRLKVVQIPMPPLRERRSDVPLLAAHFLREHNQKENKQVQRISDAVMRAMRDYHWEGNVRELRNLIYSMVVLDRDQILDLDDLELADCDGKLCTPAEPEKLGPDSLVGRPLAEIQRYYVERALEMTEGNRGEAARLLGIGERTLYRNINEWKEEEELRKVLHETGGDLSAAAERLNLSLSELQRKAKKLGLETDED